MTDFIEVPASKRSLAIRRPIFGVGINDSPYLISNELAGHKINCPYYQVWISIISRCYSEKVQDSSPTYKGCKVSEDWKVFTNFKRWMERQDWQGKQIDKDIICPGNKEYSSSNCVFVSRALNSLLTNRSNYRGLLPQGVDFNKASGKYRANCRVFSRKIYIGQYNTKEEASVAYNHFKADHILNIAKDYTHDKRIYCGLILHSDLIRSGAV